MSKKPSEEEERYTQERELERRKEAELQKELGAIREQEASKIADILGIENQNLAMQLVDLGFDAETAGIFPLIPLVYVAWADGDVSNAERRKILEFAEARGANAKHPGYVFLEQLLSHQPRREFLDTCLQTLRALYSNLPNNQTETAKQDLISLSLSVANASGGFLGLFGEKVSSEEQTIIDDIIRQLNLHDSPHAQELLNKIS